MARSRKNAFTLIELSVVVTAMVAIIGAAASFYVFVVNRTMTDSTRAAVTVQANALANELTAQISCANVCDLQFNNGKTALRCGMPKTGTDWDGDGLLDTFSPTSASTNGKENMNPDVYVWFYQASSTGSFGSTGTMVWRADHRGPGGLAGADADARWSKIGTRSRWNFIDSVTFSVDSTNKTTTFTIVASSLNRAETTASSSTSTSDNAKITISRTVFWRYWR